MEFFRTIPVSTSEQRLRELIHFDSLSEIYPDMIVLGGEGTIREIGSYWGEFQLQRDEIMGGLRFSMLDCPNALTWTVTTGYPPLKDGITLHLTINRTEKPRQFVEEINELLDGWEEGLKGKFDGIKAEEDII